MAKSRKTAKRTVLYSRSGKKLYAKRSKSGKFTDIQSYQRAHGADLKRRSKAEAAGAAKKPGAGKARKASTASKSSAPRKAGTAGKPAAKPGRDTKAKVKRSVQQPATAAARAYAIAPKPAASGEEL